MSQRYDSTKERKYKHLDIKKRAQLELLLRQKMPKAEIARMLGIARSTVYEEIKRGSVKQMDSELRTYQRYFADAGQRVYEQHRSNSRNPLKMYKVAPFLKYAEEQMLQAKRSPDVICGEARRKRLFSQMVCTKTLYNYIDQGMMNVRNIDLLLRVRRNNRKVKEAVNKRIYGLSIEQRPAAVDDREEFGHWEIDTIVGTQATSEVLLCLDERKTRMRFLVKIPSRTAAAVREGIRSIRQQLGDYAPLVFKTITSDNGSEFASLSDDFPEALVYYAHPYSSFERGTNENQNSIVRRFFPKKRCFSALSDDAVSFVQSWINALPRKLFSYLSAAELFADELFKICPT